MKKSLRIAGTVLVAAFIFIQFIRPDKNLGASTPEHLFRQTKVPAEVQATLNKACMDCHSDQTRYQWYHEIAPVSWVVRNHIDEGKHELNFSEWGGLDTLDRIGALDAVSREIGKNKMPLKSYTLIHRDAVLSTAELDSLKDWISGYQNELVNTMQ